MSDAAITPASRATAIYEAGDTPRLLCSHCAGEVTDDDADCPTCTSPLDWGASIEALREWQRAGGTYPAS
jgi:hypothetical protein